MAKYFLICLLHLTNSALQILSKPYEPSTNFPLDELTEVHVTKRKAPELPGKLGSNDVLVDGLADKYEYDVKLKVMEAMQNLKLKLPDSLFMPDFKFGIVGADRFGKPTFSDRTPSKQLIESIEKNIYVDAAADAALSLRNVDGQFHLNGYLNGARIKRGEDRHFISTREADPERSISKEDARREVVDKKRRIAMRRGFSLDKPTEVVSEVLAVFDYLNSQTFQFDTAKAIEYASILFNSVNNRFSTSPDPKITFKLAGVYLINSTEAQAFIEAGKTDKGYSINTILGGFSTWVNQNKDSLPRFDTIPLLTGIKSETSQSGVAYLKGACFNGDKWDPTAQSASVSIDNGKSWSGAHTVTHELAHNHGSDHDGDGGSADCVWEDGYIMSYEGWGKANKFLFSECSRRQMKIFIESTGGACLWSKEAESYVDTTKAIGDVLDRDEHCRLLTGNPNSVAQEAEGGDEFCRKTTCKSQEPDGRSSVSWFSESPGDYTPCGVGGKCLLGACVNNTENPLDRLNLNSVCQKKIKPKAVFFPGDSTPDQQCQVIKCKVGAAIYTLTGVLVPENAFPCGKDGNCVAGGCMNNTEDPSDYLDLNKICKKRASNEAAVLYADRPPNEQCTELKCQVGNSIYSYGGWTAPENAFPCGKNGVCKGKACVEQ